MPHQEYPFTSATRPIQKVFGSQEQDSYNRAIEVITHEVHSWQPNGAFVMEWLFVALYVPLQIYTIIRWSGVWRIAALVPPLLIFLVYPFVASSVNDSHNQMGPFAWVIFAYVEALFGAGYLVALLILRGLVMYLKGKSE